MKIIKVENFDDEIISDVLIAENVSKRDAEHIVNLLNEDNSCDKDCPYFSVVDDYELYEFLPPKMSMRDIRIEKERNLRL